MKFYRCKHCGNIIAMVKESGVRVKCCGEEMYELIPGEVDAALEKHVPVFEKHGNILTVKVGEVAHPMLDNHYIEWIAIKTNKGNQRKLLRPGEEPKAEFALLEGEEVQEVYEYCNLHGLWRSK